MNRTAVAKVMGCERHTVGKLLRKHAAGQLAPRRTRTSTAGVMPWWLQDQLLMINAFYPTDYHDELAVKLFRIMI